MTRPHRSVRIAALLFPILWGMGWILYKSFPDYPPGNDGCLYLTMAKGFAQGTGYRDITSPDAHAGTLQSPSFWPLLLSLYWRLPWPSLAALRVANAFLLCLTSVPCFFWLRFFLAELPAFLIVVAIASSWVNVFLGNSFMTETVFMPLLYCGLLLSRRGLEAEAGRGTAIRWGALIIWTMTARTRVVGWFFWATYMFLLGRRREWPKVAAGAAMMAAWILFEQSMAAGVRVSQYKDGMFTGKYPLLVNLKMGALALWGNLKDTLWAWVTAGQAHALFPWFYYAHPMDKAKRLVCAAVCLAVFWGLALAWRRQRACRPWILATLAANAPTFMIFHPQDTWRYMHPFLPFACLFLVLAFQSIPFPKRAAAGLAVCLLLVFAQALHSYERDMDDDYIDQSRDFRALHDAIMASPVKPGIILSPDHYYTWLRIGIPVLNDYGRQQFLADVIPYLNDRVTWAIRGSANAYYVESWERAGVEFSQPPVIQVRQWQVLRAGWRGD